MSRAILRLSPAAPSLAASGRGRFFVPLPPMAGGGLLGHGLGALARRRRDEALFPVANEIGAPGLYQRLVHQAVIFQVFTAARSAGNAKRS